MVGGGVAVPQTMQNDPSRWEKGETSVDRWETSVKSCEAEQNILGDKLKNNMKSCGQRTQSVVGDSGGRQVRNHTDNSIQSGLGDKWESLKSRQRSRV